MPDKGPLWADLVAVLQDDLTAEYLTQPANHVTLQFPVGVAGRTVDQPLPLTAVRSYPSIQRILIALTDLGRYAD